MQVRVWNLLLRDPQSEDAITVSFQTIQFDQYSLYNASTYGSQTVEGTRESYDIECSSSDDNVYNQFSKTDSNVLCLNVLLDCVSLENYFFDTIDSHRCLETKLAFFVASRHRTSNRTHRFVMSTIATVDRSLTTIE
jgi:hypothetical protein